MVKRAQLRPLLGVSIAIAVTTTMDATGLTMFSALALFPLMGLFWFLDKFSRAEMGFRWGEPRHHGLAILHPVAVLAGASLIAALAGVVDLSNTDWAKTWINLALGGLSTLLVAIVTEEGFFRGWLWASLKRAGLGDPGILIWTSIAFSLWHVSAVTLDTGFDLPPAQIPVFLANAAVIGAIWGLLRWLSGSVVVASVGHGVWNGINYALFAFGTKVGALGIQETAIFGPEVGFVGLGLNAAFLWALWRQVARRMGAGN